MNKILIPIFTILCIMLSVNSFTQNDVQIDLDALKYFNKFLSNKSVIDDVKGELIFDKYSNALNYKSTTLMYDNPTLETDVYLKLSTDFQIPLDQINRIEEIIHQKGSIIVMQFKFHLNINVKRTIETKEKGEWLDKKTTETNIVFFTPAGSIDSNRLQEIQKVIRDIFTNIEIETNME